MPATLPPPMGPVPVLYVAFELGATTWKLGSTTGFGQPARERTVPARDLAAITRELAEAKRTAGLPGDAAVVSCYEAGRDGFWLHRYLASVGVANRVVDSSSIEVKRRARRAKTDRLDVQQLLSMLVRVEHGERKVWSVVRVPSPADEDRRQLHRELGTLTREQTRLTNRIKGLLASQGVVLPVQGDLRAQLAAVRLWDGTALGPALTARLEREWAAREAVRARMRALAADRHAFLTAPADAAARDRAGTIPPEVIRQVERLVALRGIGEASAWLLVMELFGWRTFNNRREVGALLGLTATPYQSGESTHEQGISKAGNRRVRALAVQLAWAWLRYQPESALTQWYRTRFAAGGPRPRRVGIVALARKLLIALWRYLAAGEVPVGAVVRA
jgi:transposase